MKKLMFILFFAIANLLNAQEAAGDWMGTLEVQGMKLNIVFHITNEDGKYTSTMDSPDQGAAGIAMDKTTFENGKLTIEAKAMRMKYSAKLMEDGKRIMGTFNQGGMELPLNLAKGKATEKITKNEKMVKSEKIEKAILGDWNGVLEVQGMQLTIVMHIMEEDGFYKTTMDSPDQGAKGIAMDRTSFENRKLTIGAKAMRLEYTAKLSEDGTKVEGDFKQNGMNIPLVLTREKVAKKVVVRPQEPKDFPYLQEEVKFVNPKGGHHLAGTLTMPTDGKFDKVAVLITGSGPQDRNEELLNHKPFLVISDYFTRHGIAVLRFDDRGVGESEGKFKGATTRDFADDVASAVAFLKTRKDMAGKKIGLVGHSEGGMIAPMVASENKTVDFMVLLAGPGIPIKELMMLQTDKIAEVEGAPEKMRRLNAMVMDKAFDFLKSNSTTDKEELKKGLFKIFDKLYVELTDEEKEELGTKEEFFEGEAKMMLSDWFLYFMRFEPADYLTKVKCPVLAVNGELDLQVTSTENLEGIRQSLKTANNTNTTIHEFKGMNHLFQKCKTGAPSEYASIEETFNEEVLAFVTKWILNN